MVMARARQFRVRRWVLAATAVLVWIALVIFTAEAIAHRRRQLRLAVEATTAA